MATLIDTPPDHIIRGSAFTMFRWGDNLNIGSEITCVYSPTGTEGWKAVRYQVVASEIGNPTVQVLDERDLTPDEIAHFEALMRDE